MADSIMINAGGGGGEVKVEYVDYLPDNTVAYLESLNPLPTSRLGMMAATDGRGVALFCGGAGKGIRAEVDTYTNGIKSTLANLSTARYNGVGATDGRGVAIIAGGMSSSTNSSTVDAYTNGVRSTLPALSVACQYLAATTDGRGVAIFAGGEGDDNAGSTVDAYTNGVRSALPALSSGRARLAATTDGRGVAIFAGGSCSAAVDAYTNGIRSIMEPLSVARSFLAATTDGSGAAIFAGGLDDTTWGTRCANVDAYTDGLHTVLEALISPRDHIAGATSGNGDAVFYGGTETGSTPNLLIIDVYRNKKHINSTVAGKEGVYDAAATTDGRGIPIFAGGYPTDKNYVNAFKSKINITVPVGSKYRINSTAEKIATTNEIQIDTTTQKINGYVKYVKGVIQNV